MRDQIKSITDDYNFTKAVKITIASVFPVLILSYFNLFTIGFNVALGAFLASTSDIPSNLKHKINGILVAIFIISGATFLINILHPYPYIFYPALALMVFFLSMISVYGLRATMVSFSGLLAVAIALGKTHVGWDILYDVLYIVSGGFFYLFVSLTFYYIKPYRYLEIQIAEGLKLTSKYLKLRSNLWNLDANRSKIIEKQLKLQVELNTIHEDLREILIRNRSKTGSSNQNRRMLIVFISLVEIMELAISTSFDHAKLHQKFDSNPIILKTYQNLAFNLSNVLKQLSQSIINNTKYSVTHSLLKDLEDTEIIIRNYEKQSGENSQSETVLMLTNMLHYAEKQVEKIILLERIFTSQIAIKEYKIRDKELEKFLTPQYYPLSTLLQNLSLSSTVFRHSIRLTITVLTGIFIGQLFSFNNAYWIVLTIIVIMRPGYGLTKQRSIDRIFGTILGALIAFGILYITNNTIITSTLSIICILLAFTFTQSNYKIGATFVTMYVVFVYGMLVPDIDTVIINRIVDTLTGSALAFAANYLLWPSWEFINIKSFIKKSVEANRNYILQISILYNLKGDVTIDYKVSRKQAFIELGNLMTSFQRMEQEPKSKQKQMSQIYKITELSHTLLSASASLGSYVQTHKTSKASEAFNVVINAVTNNLNEAISVLNSDKNEILEYKNYDKEVAIRFKELREILSKELLLGNMEDEKYKLKMQEFQLVIEQLIWLTSLSESIMKSSRTISSN